MAITRRGTQIFKLAADAKPTATDVQAGTELINTDDRKRYINSGTEWIPQDFPLVNKFNVFIEGSKTYVTDLHGKVQGSATETEDAINPIMAAQPNNNIYVWEWDPVVYTLYSPILLSTHVAGQFKKNIFENKAFSGSRASSGGVAYLRPDSTFADNRYLIEATNPVGSASVSQFEIDGFQASNVDNFTTKDVGFLKLEGDASNTQQNWRVSNLYLNYMWRPIHLIGHVWNGIFENIVISVSNSGFASDSGCFTLQDGGHTSGFNPTPKLNIFRNLSSHSGDGSYTAFLDMKSGGYNLFDTVFVDGKLYTLAPLLLNNTDTSPIHNNLFRNLQTLDATSQTGIHAALYLAGTACYDNVFEKCRFSLLNAKMIKVEGAGVMNNDIEIDAYWGAQTATVNHVNPGEGNILRVFGGAKTTAGQVPVSLTGTVANRLAVKDLRRAAENGGIATTRTDGSTIAHGLMATPAWYFVTGTVAGQIVTATADATNLTLGIKTGAGSAGTSQSVAWRAGVYA